MYNERRVQLSKLTLLYVKEYKNKKGLLGESLTDAVNEIIREHQLMTYLRDNLTNPYHQPIANAYIPPPSRTIEVDKIPEQGNVASDDLDDLIGSL